MTEDRAPYITDVDESKAPKDPLYKPFKCAGCGKVLGYVYRDNNRVRKLLVPTESGPTFHISEAAIDCSCGFTSEFYQGMESLAHLLKTRAGFREHMQELLNSLS